MVIKISINNEFITFRNGFPEFFKEINNYKSYIEKLLIEHSIDKYMSLHSALRLLQIQLTNLTIQLNLIEKILM